MIANRLRAANHSRTFLPSFSKLRMAKYISFVTSSSVGNEPRVLDSGFREGCCDGFGKAFEPVHDGDQDVPADAEGHIDCLVLDHAAVSIADLDPERVKMTMGYIRSSARDCHSRTSSSTTSVTRLIRSGDT